MSIINRHLRTYFMLR